MKALFKIKHGPLLVDIAVILLCVLACQMGFSFANDNKASLTFLAGAIGEAFRLLPQAADAWQAAALLVIPIHALLFYAAAVILGRGFLPVIYFAFFRARLQVASEKKLYASEEDLYYFRDTFPDMKPATVSLLMDLEIDAAKDVPASLLQMVDKGLLKLNEKGFAPGATPDDMSGSEKELARLALGKKADLARWKALSIGEGIACGCLQKADGDEVKRRMFKYLVVAGVCFALAFILSAVSGDGLEFFGVVERGIEHLPLFFLMPHFASYVLLALLFWAVMGTFIASMVLLVYMSFFESRYNKLRAPVRRTARGRQAARRLYGIKNYIHDFTLLSEATQKQVSLWNDFLVYAIVLEENTDIVAEISRHYPSIDLRALQKIP